MGTNNALILVNLFSSSYEADFIQKLLGENKKKLALSFNVTFRNMDDVRSLNNAKFGDCIY